MRRPTKLITTSFRLTKDVHTAFKEKVPAHGDRSRLISKMVELFITGKIQLSEELVLITGDSK